MFIGRIAIIAIILVAIVTIVVVLVARRRGADGQRRPLLLVAGRFIGAAYACLTLVVTAVTVITTLVAEQIEVALPVREYWPGVYPWIADLQGPTAEVTAGGFQVADVTVAGLGMDARAFLAAGHALQGATFIVIAVTIALLCQRLLAGSAFTPSMTRAVSVSGLTVAIGGMAWQVLHAVGGSIASAQVLEVSGWRAESFPWLDEVITEYDGSGFDPVSAGLPDPGIMGTIDLWPLLLGLALAAVAFAFRGGERLQRDTEGLV